MVGSGEPNVGRLGQNIHRPKITSSAGQQGDHHQERDGDADGEDRTEAGRRVQVGEGQAQHADHDGGGAGQDRRGGAVQRERHRLVPVLVAA